MVNLWLLADAQFQNPHQRNNFSHIEFSSFGRLATRQRCVKAGAALDQTERSSTWSYSGIRGEAGRSNTD
jgi:hypothetical protein